MTAAVPLSAVAEKRRILLLGMPNCGKTTLFNRLTGSQRKTGNLPGVTVEAGVGTVLGIPSLSLVDLPGVCSLFPVSEDEAVTAKALFTLPFSFLLYVLDGAAPRQGLALLAELLTLGYPTVLAVNRCDEVALSGGSIRCDRLARLSGCPVYPVSAATGEGISALLSALADGAPPRPLPVSFDRTANDLLDSLERELQKSGDLPPLPPRFLAAALLSGERLPAGFTSPACPGGEALVRALERREGVPRDCRWRIARYRFAAGAAKAFTLPPHPPVPARSERVDRLLLHPLLGIPIFLLLLLSLFLLTFTVFAPLFARLSDLLFGFLGAFIRGVLEIFSVSPALIGFITDGLLGGVAAVLSFVPTLLLLFFFLTLLEDSGYLARVSYLTDPLMRRLGLSGRCVIPALLGFGCSVPAVLACRTLPDRASRRKTAFLIPFFTCSAKLPLLFALSALLFGRAAGACVLLFVFASALLGFLLLRLPVRRGLPTPAGMYELPPYRMPTAKTVAKTLASHARAFFSRAGGAVLLSSALIWFLAHTAPGGGYLPNGGEGSLLFAAARFLLPIFRPAGIFSPVQLAALVSGLFAKEAVLGAIASLGGFSVLGSGMTLSCGLPFLAFFMLYPPCIAAFSVTCRETGRIRTVLLSLLRCVLAYAVAALLFRLFS